MGRPKKRIILFIVEGPSDLAALERPISRLLDNNAQGIEATFLVAENDVTSDSRNNPNNLLHKIDKWYLDPFFSSNSFCYPKDILEVVQICDLDGTFIPDEYCCPYRPDQEGADSFIYEPPYIYANSVGDIIDRNHRKAENIKFLLAQKCIKVRSKTVPYSLFFFSSNIDHFIHDKLNIPGREKYTLAGQFADKCDDDINYFFDIVCNQLYSLNNMGYEESWSYIMTDGCEYSINRHTNFNIYINKLLGMIKGE